MTLVKLETYEIDDLGLEIKNVSKEELKDRGLKHGVKVSRATSNEMARYNLEGIIITQINDTDISSIEDAKLVSYYKSSFLLYLLPFPNSLFFLF